MTSKPKHDALVKKILTNQIAAQEFLEYYLPLDFKKLINLSQVKIEKESFVTGDLKRQLSDIIYSVPTKNGDNAFVYCLLEHQSTSDHLISLRLWQYMLLLLERHKRNKGKLPLICPIVIYAGKEPYTAPKNIWQLFADPKQAKKLMTADYKLIDLQSTSDDEIIQKRHLGMLEYMLKHIHQRDIIKLWDEFLSTFKSDIVVDREKGYVYIRSFLCYTDTKLSVDRQQELEQVIVKYLSEEEKDNIMKTIAQAYEEKGEARGEAKKAISIAKNLLKVGIPINLISKSTGLDESFILSLTKS